jgi:hypothetical protein
MDSSKSIEDDTIRDQMEGGYVATRPRFTRARRTWKMNVRNLVAEDIRALDEFAMVKAARGGNAFLYPNLLTNGSFELPATVAGDLVSGWSAASTPSQESISISTATAEDGTQAILAGTVNGASIPANSTVTGTVAADQAIACSAGEVYVFTASINAAQGTLAGGVLNVYVQIKFFNAAGNQVGTSAGSNATLGGGWQSYGCQFTVPASAARFTVALITSLVNGTASAIALDGSASVAWDAAACALLTPLTPYGRMVGSQPLGCLVRFGKLPETSDIGFGDGVKRYGCTFELMEV